MVGQKEAKDIVARCVAAVNANKTCGIGDVMALLYLYSAAKTEIAHWKKERDLYFDALEKAVAERDVVAKRKEAANAS